MANRVKGEVAFEAEGVQHVLVLDFNAMCSLEDELDIPLAQLGEAMTGGRMSLLRSVFRAALEARQPGITSQQAGHLIQVIGLPRTTELIGEAFAAANPAVEGEQGGRPPRKARAGTGS